MKILFFMRSTVYVRNFESTLRMLADRGHDVHVIADPYHLSDSSDLISRLCRDYPQINHSRLPAVPFNTWAFLGIELRRAIDYLRYLGPEFGAAMKLRLRAERNAPEFVIAVLKKPLAASRVGRSVLARVLHWCDRAVPRDPAIDEFIRAQHPDLVLVTPLVEPGSPQAEYLRSARALGIRTGLCVYSWDNLTNKGLIHDPLDLVTVWNEAMKEEAVALHHVPADKVVVTGAVPYDHWFTWQPRESREAFCDRVGLRADRPYLLYLCSSKFIAPNEVEFVRRWVRELRVASPTLRGVGVLVRPHPQNTEEWETADLSDLEHVAVWPRTGANPVDDDSRADYYDSIYHSKAVVGVNTSALIESAIVGRGAYTVLAPEFRETQDGTLHFRHLRHHEAGLLHLAETFSGHIEQLEAAVRGSDGGDRRRRFVETFVRPHGVDVPAAPRLVAALEQVATRGPASNDRGPWWGPLIRPGLAGAARWLARSETARRERSAREEQRRQRRQTDAAARRAASTAAKQHAKTERTLRKRRAVERAEAERRTHDAVAASAYERYLQVRDSVRHMCQGNGRETVPFTVREQQMVAALAPLWNADPQVVAKLRWYCEPISGIRASDYDAPSYDFTLRLRRDLHVLRREVGPELFVQEPATLGGFGYVRNGERFNEDTLKFFKAIAALHEGGVLGAYRRTAQRAVVWEIGGGWGGFAHQFKTICPNVTYLITGIPDLFLVSAVYLGAVFPGARCRFYDKSSGDDFWDGWEDVDFIFAPESALPTLRLPRIDLTLDVMALRHMSESRVGSHVQRSFDMGSRYFYSLMPSDDADDEAPSAWGAIERLYWTHPIPPHIDSWAVDDESDVTPESDYAHLVGWRRLRV